MPNSRQLKQYDLLNKVVDTTPIIDHHAHLLFRNEYIKKDGLRAITSEAGGDALGQTFTSLAHIRAVKQLSQVLGCEQTWDAVTSSLAQRRATSPDAWTRRCLEGIETILVDDGLNLPDGTTHPYSWLSSFTESKCKRIVRIEVVAEDIIQRHCDAAVSEAKGAGDPGVLVLERSRSIRNQFEAEIKRYLADPEVVGFKSVLCYRGGLDIPSRGLLDLQTPDVQLAEIVHDYITGKRDFDRRLDHGVPNFLFVHETARLINESSGPFKKPFQFHTGLGDIDITLSKSSPAYMQTFIEEYPKVPIVLLHAAYPYTREAGYLAAMYSHVYADVGEVFPVVSRHGQEDVVRQILELCPWEKILWSTDGHLMPETYLLATIQMRAALKTVLSELVEAGDLGEEQAAQLAQDVLFTNAKKLYHLSVSTELLSIEQIGASRAAD